MRTKALRLILLSAIVVSGVGLLTYVVLERTNTPLGRTLAPIFSFMGKSAKTFDRLLSRVVPIDKLDEKTLGEAIKHQFEGRESYQYESLQYVRGVLYTLMDKIPSKFQYQVFIVEGPPNAMALPGGVVLVTQGLLQVLDTEAQLAAILGHEIGHIELGHCYDGVRFELLAAKIGARPLGEIADMTYRIAVGLNFSKTQESESDRYGFDALTATEYHPLQMAEAFRKLEAGRRERGVDPFRDYLASHPPVALRIENYEELGRRYLAKNPGKYYVGGRNYKEKLPRLHAKYPEELRP